MENEHYRVARRYLSLLKIQLGLLIIILHNDHMLDVKIISTMLFLGHGGGVRLKVSGHHLLSQVEQMLALSADDVAKHLVAELDFLYAWWPLMLFDEIMLCSLHNQVVKL